MENQFRQILSYVSLPQSWANRWNTWLDRDEIVEKQTAEETLQKLKDQLSEIDRRTNILLDSYLDQIIDSETFKQKKNQFFEEKIKFQEMIAKVELQGSTWSNKIPTLKGWGFCSYVMICSAV